MWYEILYRVLSIINYVVLFIVGIPLLSEIFEIIVALVTKKKKFPKSDKKAKIAYLIPAYRTSGEESDHWDPEYVAPAEMYADLVPVDGTVDNFLSDPESILILDKDLWDEYSSVLTGHVILYDNSYLIFSNEMYWWQNKKSACGTFFILIIIYCQKLQTI